MYIALVGNISEGYKAIGPFANFDDAAQKTDGLEAWIMELESLVETDNSLESKEAAKIKDNDVVTEPGKFFGQRKIVSQVYQNNTPEDEFGDFFSGWYMHYRLLYGPDHLESVFLVEKQGNVREINREEFKNAQVKYKLRESSNINANLHP